MESNKKNLIIGIIGLIAGIAFVAYGVVNLMQSNKENNDVNNPNNQEEEPEVVSEDEVEEWLTDDNNSKVISYFVDFETDFDRDTAETTDYSNFFGNNFMAIADEQVTLEDSDYTYEYTISKEEIETFLSDFFGDLKMDMFDVNEITLSKDNFNFIDDGENVKIQMTEELTPTKKSVLDNINVYSNEEIDVTYGIMDIDATCEENTTDCYTGYRKIVLKKSENGFNILKSLEELKSDAEDNSSAE